MHISNASAVNGVTWQKSGRCSLDHDCVELGALPSGDVAVRNSRDRRGPALVFTKAEIEAFINGACNGDFANLVA